MKLKDPSLLQTRCLIDGQWLDADSGKTIAVTNPATGETIAHVPDMGAAETRRAIDAAEAARAAWQKESGVTAPETTTSPSPQADSIKIGRAHV